MPPHPGPTAIANIFKADIGKTLSYRIFIAIPALIFAGLIFPEFLKKIQANPPKEMFASKKFTDNEIPSFGKSFFCALIPVLLMGFATIGEFFVPISSQVFIILKSTGDPGISMLIALLVALWTNCCWHRTAAYRGYARSASTNGFVRRCRQFNVSTCK